MPTGLHVRATSNTLDPLPHKVCLYACSFLFPEPCSALKS